MALSIRDSGSLIEAAKSRTGLSDFGETSFREPLDLLVGSVNSDMDLHEGGVDYVEETIIRSLSNRLQIEAWYAAHPDVDTTEINAMTLVVGLPRSGTTALVGMLAADESFRALRQWEAVQPCPPPVLGAETDDPRRAAAEGVAAQLSDELKAMHIMDPLGPEEDHDLLALSFRSGHYQGFFPVTRYTQWWLNTDMGPTWAYHRRCLKLLGSRRPPHDWLLKAPLHLFELSHFLEHYPNTRFVMTHRDPAKTIPSMCSLTRWAHQMAAQNLDMQRHGAFNLEFWAEGMRRALQARDGIGEDRFIDVLHSDLISNPMSEIARIYKFLGKTMTPEAKTAIEQYIKANASDGTGPHQYTAEEFGLNAAQITAQFSEYLRRFPAVRGNAK